MEVVYFIIGVVILAVWVNHKVNKIADSLNPYNFFPPRF